MKAWARVAAALLAVSGSLGIAAGLAPVASGATYGAATILDLSPDSQFDLADSPVISADGHYVAFRGSVDGHSGIWRRNVQTGALDPVAIDLQGLPAGASNYDPQAPSISADGRYIAFNTEAALDPANDPATSRPCQVYVRDMTKAVGEPGAFTLASAVDGGTKSLTYADTNGAHLAGSTRTSLPNSGNALASPGGAISGDGRRVVFSVDSGSNLANPSSAATTTPGFQVAVRDLATDTTKLVSDCEIQTICSASGLTVGGPVTWAENTVSGGAVDSDDAVISGDGTTVTWLSDFGAVRLETSTLNQEETLYLQESPPSGDRQAVWRRIADGPVSPILPDRATAPIRRVTGEVDPLRPDCPPGATVTSRFQVPAGCQGPLAVFEGAGSLFSHLSISRDGYDVALLSGAPLPALPNPSVEAYLVDMHDGLTREQATTALTQASATARSNGQRESDIVADAISPDGSTVALSTKRTRFDLQTPSYLGPARPGAASGNELYIVNRRDATLDLVSYAYNGALANYPACAGESTESPSLSDDGALVAFDSCATNLVWGDGNGASNVYVEARIGGSAGDGLSRPAQQAVGPPPPLAMRPAWVIHASTRPLANGDLELFVLVPGAGRVGVQVTAKLAVSHAARRRRRPRTVVRTVAAASASPRRAGLTTLTVHLKRGYVALAGRQGGLHARAALSFSVRGAATPLHDTIAVTFRRRRHASRRPR
jgi:WD40-like Beta Propeller Repeat